MRLPLYAFVALFAGSGACLVVPEMAQAAPITYSVGVDIIEGPLAGKPMSGWFTFDSSIIPADGTGDVANRDGIGLLDVSISFGSFTYDETTTDASFMRFLGGELVSFVVGAYPDINGVHGGIDDFFVGSTEFFYSMVGMEGSGYGVGVSFARVVSVPEPVTLALFGVGLLGLLSLQRRLGTSAAS